MMHYLRRNSICDCGFLSRNHGGQKEMEQHLKSSSRKTLELSILYPEGKTKSFSDELAVDML